jgi:hypothetical protein
MAVSPFLSAGRPAWRRWPVWVAAAVVVVLAVAGSLVWHAKRAASKPFVPLSAGTPERPPGLSAAKVDKVLKDCLNENARKDAVGARVYNVVVTGYATDALIYSKNWIVGCLKNQNNTGGTSTLPTETDAQWIPGVASIDLRAGQDHLPWMTKPGYDVIGGRVPRGITEVTVTIRGKTAKIPVLNGTYLARIPRDGLFHDTYKTVPAVVRTFNAAGKQVGTVEARYPEGSWAPALRCVVTPAGRRVTGDPLLQPAPGPCITATRWN